MVEKRRKERKKKRTLKQKVWEKKEECKRVNVCGDSKFGDKCNSSSGALKSKKY